MISRREVVTAGMFGTLAAASPSVVSEIQSDVQALKEGFKNLDTDLDSLRSSVDQGLRGNSMNFGNVGNLKSTIQKWAGTSGRFPEYVDIGLDVFYDVYDWHIRHNQQIQIARVADQRIMILFMFTQCILRWENAGTYVGTPY